MQLALETTTKHLHDRDAEIVGLKEVVAEKKSEIEEANRQFREHETIRRKLHNTIQELKVNFHSYFV